MADQDRDRQIKLIAELLLVHLPECLQRGDQALAHDLLAVLGTALRAIQADVEKSAQAWDKRAYHVKADELRREWDWLPGATNYALGLARRPAPLTAESLDKVRRMIAVTLERPARRQISDPERFRGALKALGKQER